jgi:hypothetical protein
MHVKKVLLWGGTVFSVALCILALVGGALTLFFLATGDHPPESFKVAYTSWFLSFAGTFILSVVFLIFMLRKGELGS